MTAKERICKSSQTEYILPFLGREDLKGRPSKTHASSAITSRCRLSMGIAILARTCVVIGEAHRQGSSQTGKTCRAL